MAHYFGGDGNEGQETEEWRKVKREAEEAAAAASFDPFAYEWGEEKSIRRGRKKKSGEKKM